MVPITSCFCVAIVALSLFSTLSESASQAYRRDPGHQQWHHGAFQDVKENVRSEVRQMLHSRAEVLALWLGPKLIYMFIDEGNR
uniref:Uncharacterized protein n=1 Tax=Solanum lycopersicum TaxID=4081 RepID=A0A3Q7EEZ1_SOLLC